MIRFILIALSFLIITNGKSQDSPWPATFFTDSPIFPIDTWEHYDKGYLMAAWRCKDNAPTTSHSGLIVKTDINGQILWQKQLIAPNTIIAIQHTALTNDGGIIVSGLINGYDPGGDPFLIKLDACGHKEWCKIFHTPNHSDNAQGVVALPDGGFVFNWKYPSEDLLYKRNALLKLDESGDVIWKTYVPQQTGKIKTLFEKYYELKYLLDGNLLLVGETNIVDPEDSTNLLKTKPIWLKVDLNGDELWKQTWRPYDQMFSGWVEDACQISSGSIYSPGRVFGKPHLYKITNNGDTLYRNILNPYSSNARASTISSFSDNSLIIGMSYGIDWEDDMTVVRTDTLGNILIERVLIDGSEMIPSHGITTYDNHALLMAPGRSTKNFDIVLFKLDENLEDAPFDYGTYTYDSLCPDPITNDTIWVEGDIIIGQDEPDNLQANQPLLQIQPNPASNQVEIVLPEQITEQLNTNGVSFSHTQYQYKGVLEVFNLQGKRMRSVNAQQGETIHIDINHWPSGLYGLQLIVNGRKVAAGKLVKE